MEHNTATTFHAVDDPGVKTPTPWPHPLDAQVRGLFAELGEKLQGGRRRYLVGDTFTAADLTFASMAAIVLLPEEYGGKRGEGGRRWVLA